jgi:hypothetical protein
VNEALLTGGIDRQVEGAVIGLDNPLELPADKRLHLAHDGGENEAIEWDLLDGIQGEGEGTRFREEGGVEMWRCGDIEMWR